MVKRTKKTVIIFLDTDKHVSSFDIITAIDVLSDVETIAYGNVLPEDTKRIVQDAIFPRGSEGARNTKLFIGGHDMAMTARVLDAAQSSMYPPFELAIIVDPRGAYTTASAAVAKTLAAFREKCKGGIRKVKVTVLAGTGPIGQMASRLYAMEGASVVITSRNLARSSAVASKINVDLGIDLVRGVKALGVDEAGAAIDDADIVLATGAAEVNLLSLKVLKEHNRGYRVVGDVNAIPPLGVEGIKPTDDGAEFMRDIYGMGSLAIGAFKQQVEAQIFMRAAETTKGVFGLEAAYEIAKSMIAKIE